MFTNILHFVSQSEIGIVTGNGRGARIRRGLGPALLVERVRRVAPNPRLVAEGLALHVKRREGKCSENNVPG